MMLAMILLRILSMNYGPKSIHETQEKIGFVLLEKLKGEEGGREGGWSSTPFYTISFMQEKTHTYSSNHVKKLIVYYSY